MKRAFLKWAGGKSQSLKMINDEIGFIKGKLIEPFVGSGIVTLNIEAIGYIIADFNEDLINLYKTLKKDKEDFIRLSRDLFTDTNNNEEAYYKYRNQFNLTDNSYEKAILFLYLNRHCFNGLCRYNKKNKFNVPFGDYKKVYFPEQELLEFSDKLSKCGVYCQSFEETIKMANTYDVVYADPPYIPLNGTAYFTDYSPEGFGMEQQIALAKLAEESCCKFMISNHDTDETRELYKNADKIITRNINRFISSKGQERKPVKELLAIYY